MGSGWASLAEPFCEGVYLRGLPAAGVAEFANMLSSFVLMIFGLLGLWLSGDVGPFIRYFYSLLFTTGIGSAAFHATLMQGWGFVDTTPMIILLSAGVVAFVEELLQRTANRTTTLIVSGLTYMLMAVYVVLTISLSAADPKSPAFDIMFGLPFFFIVPGMLWVWFDPAALPRDEQSHYVRRLVWYAVIPGLLGLVFWLIDRLACSPGVAYARLHALWHIGIAISAYYLITVTSYMRADNQNGRRAILYTWPSDQMILFAYTKWPATVATVTPTGFGAA
eukprot:PLAT7159.1.p1 GENE.PLAT7159.1~~PLAT7159.1.p1  ORF type:complete len:305 (+),score=43.08 PLAT7159.1:79-915(+)